MQMKLAVVCCIGVVAVCLLLDSATAQDRTDGSNDGPAGGRKQRDKGQGVGGGRRGGQPRDGGGNGRSGKRGQEGRRGQGKQG